jgi:S-(hydroxymethyl)glutathione dehydrogenase/alcohol dehydrogenase
MAQGAAFARHAIAHETSVTKIPASIPFAVACLFGCAVITGIGAALHTATIRAGDSVIVFGLGGVGLNVVEGARLACAGAIIGVDSNPRKEAVARSFGLTHFVNGRQERAALLSALSALTSGGADHAFECVGSARLGELAVQATRMEWGSTVILGAPPPNDAMQIPGGWLLTGRSVRGSILGNAKTRTDMAEIAAWYVEGRLNTQKLISHRLPLEHINEGFELMKSGQAVRVVIEHT